MNAELEILWFRLWALKPNSKEAYITLFNTIAALPQGFSTYFSLQGKLIKSFVKKNILYIQIVHLWFLFSIVKKTRFQHLSPYFVKFRFSEHYKRCRKASFWEMLFPSLGYTNDFLTHLSWKILQLPDSFTLTPTHGGIMVALRTSSEPNLSETILACNIFPLVSTKSSPNDDTSVRLIPPIRTTIVFLIPKWKKLNKKCLNIFLIDPSCGLTISSLRKVI